MYYRPNKLQHIIPDKVKLRYLPAQLHRGLRAIAIVLLVGLMHGSHAKAPPERDVRDLFFGEALFHIYQDNYFQALARLDTELVQLYSLDDPKKDSLSFHREESELFIGDLELSYRMHRKVGRAMQRLLKESIHESIRDRAAYRLARIAFKKGSYEDVIEILGNISKKAPDELKQKSQFLKGQAYIALGQYEDAVTVLKPVRNAKPVMGYAAYNLGIAMIENGELVSGYKLLEQVGSLKTDTRELNALNDKANLALGHALLKAEEAQRARPFLERVRLEGPFSSKALLWVGWTDAANEHYRQALVPWMILRERDITDIAVQEAMLAAPYAFGQLKAHGKSAILYGEAVKAFEAEIERLDASIESIRDGKFIEALLREEAEQQDNWLFRLRELPDTPETRYMRDLMAGHTFHESFNNYRDMDSLRINVDQWLDALPAYHDLIRQRRAYYQPLLSRIDTAFQRLNNDLGNMVSQRDTLTAQLKSLLHVRDTMALATGFERHMIKRLDRIGAQIKRLRQQPGLDMVTQRHQRLAGYVHWRVDTEYETRLSLAHKHLKQLDQTIATAQQSYQTLRRKKAEAELSYQGYDRVLQDLQTRLVYLRDRVSDLMKHQGQYMERRAITELTRRKGRLKRYRTKARFALAESYDRARRDNAPGLSEKETPAEPTKQPVETAPNEKTEAGK